MVWYATVPGTWGFDGNGHDDDEWWQPHSEFVKFLQSHGYHQILIEGQPFVWSTNVDGFGLHRDWQSAAKALQYFLHTVPYRHRNIIAHSHGGQVALLAAANGVKIRNLITVSTPVRGDLKPVIAKARQNIGHWTHIHSGKKDFWQLFGSLWDGQIGLFRRMKQADVNVELPALDHSDLLRQPEHFHHWIAGGLAEYLNTSKVHIP